MVLMLDLDETLVRAKVYKEHISRRLAKVDFEVTIDVSGGVPCSVSVRPGVPAFLDWVRERRSAGAIEGPWLFAQGHRKYVDAILSKLDPGRELFAERVLTAEQCTIPRTPGFVLKDLARVPCAGDGSIEPPLSRMVLVDNSVLSSILYPKNVFLVRDWFGDGTADEELARAARALDAALDAAPDGGLLEALAGTTMGTAPTELQERLRGLRARLDLDPPPAKQLKQTLAAIWKEAVALKADFFGLPKGTRC